MVDGAQAAPPEQLGELVGLDLVALVPLAGVAPAITDDHPIDEWGQQIVEPLRLGALFERQVHRPAHPAEELGEGAALGGQHASCDHASARLAHRGDRAGLMDVETDILGRPFHERRSWLGIPGRDRLHGSAQGRTLNMR
jgi:hypothetical protein